MSQIKSLFDIDTEISVTRTKTDKGKLFSTDPPVCYKCFEERCREEEKEELSAEISTKDKKIESLEKSNIESETKIEKMKNEYLADVTSNNDLNIESQAKWDKTKQAEALIAESATKIEELENKLEEMKKENETIETKCKSTEETLSKFKDQTREILRKSKEKNTDTVKEVASKNNFIKHLEIQMETLKKDLKVA